MYTHRSGTATGGPITCVEEGRRVRGGDCSVRNVDYTSYSRTIRGTTTGITNIGRTAIGLTARGLAIIISRDRFSRSFLGGTISTTNCILITGGGRGAFLVRNVDYTSYSRAIRGIAETITNISSTSIGLTARGVFISCSPAVLRPKSVREIIARTNCGTVRRDDAVRRDSRGRTGGRRRVGGV